MDIRFEKREHLKEKPDQKHLGFGKYMTDYMFVMDWTKEEGWKDARMIFPIITHGMIAGIADMIGLPVIRNDVTGVITDKIIPHAIPAPSAAMIRHALMIGPVMYTLVFLKNWLTIQIASNTAVVVICFVVIFINPPLFCGAKCDCLCRSRGFSSFVLRSKMRLPLQEQRIFLLCFAEQNACYAAFA
jgi:hypothetical protein